MQSPVMPQPALCQTACHSASLYVVLTTRIGSGGGYVAYLPDYSAFPRSVLDVGFVYFGPYVWNHSSFLDLNSSLGTVH